MVSLGGFLLEEYKCLVSIVANEYGVKYVRPRIRDRANAVCWGGGGEGEVGRPTFAYGQLVFRTRQTRDQGVIM